MRTASEYGREGRWHVLVDDLFVQFDCPFGVFSFELHSEAILEEVLCFLQNYTPCSTQVGTFGNYPRPPDLGRRVPQDEGIRQTLDGGQFIVLHAGG